MINLIIWFVSICLGIYLFCIIAGTLFAIISFLLYITVQLIAFPFKIGLFILTGIYEGIIWLAEQISWKFRTRNVKSYIAGYGWHKSDRGYIPGQGWD